MKDRIKLIQSELKMSQQDFANAIGVAPGALSNVYSERTKPTSNYVTGIHKAFPTINVYWLMFGEGEMYTSVDEKSTTQEEGVAANNPTVNTNDSTVGNDAFAGTLFAQTSQPEEELVAFQQPRVTSPQTARQAANNAPKSSHKIASVQTQYASNIIANNFDTRVRKVKEIRVFYDDGTYETFVPGK